MFSEQLNKTHFSSFASLNEAVAAFQPFTMMDGAELVQIIPTNIHIQPVSLFCEIFDLLYFYAPYLEFFFIFFILRFGPFALYICCMAEFLEVKCSVTIRSL